MADYGDMFYGTLPEDTQDFRQVLAGIGRTLRDRAIAAGQRIGQSGQEAIALQNQAFADPRRPTRVTDEAALARLTDMIMGGPMGFAPAGITAYHGSPYLFRMFNPTKVGTGEGAQAYGVGSGYTAEARPVAEEYRRATTKDRFATPSGIFEPSSLEHLNVRATFRKDGLENAIELAKKYGVPNADDPETAAKAARDLQVLKSLKQSGGVQPIQGYLYKGDIPDEILPKFLDWDKPLHEQSPEVKKALSSLIHYENRAGDKPWTFKDTIESLEAAPHLRSERGMNPTGGDIYNMLGTSMMTGNKAPGQLEVTNKLNEVGIRGIRYLDRSSRDKGKGTSNFIPFRPEDYKIQEINDIPIEEWVRKGLLD